jgi:hypothetical protein
LHFIYLPLIGQSGTPMLGFATVTHGRLGPRWGKIEMRPAEHPLVQRAASRFDQHRASLVHNGRPLDEPMSRWLTGSAVRCIAGLRVLAAPRRQGLLFRPRARLLPSVALGGRAVAQQRVERRLAAILADDVAGYRRADEVIE